MGSCLERNKNTIICCNYEFTLQTPKKKDSNETVFAEISKVMKKYGNETFTSTKSLSKIERPILKKLIEKKSSTSIHKLKETIF